MKFLKFIFIGILSITAARAETKPGLIGTWELSQFLFISNDGSSQPFCKGAYGKLMYQKTGFVSVAINCPGPVTASDPAFAYGGMLFYSGTFVVNGNTILHRITNSSLQSLIGKEVERPIEALSKNGLILGGLSGSKNVRIEWKR